MSNVIDPLDLPKPLKIGDKEVTKLTFREPKSGDMRGLKTMDILQMDINAHSQLIPRICPVVTKAVFFELCPANLTAIQGYVVNFFVDADV